MSRAVQARRAGVGETGSSEVHGRVGPPAAAAGSQPEFAGHQRRAQANQVDEQVGRGIAVHVHLHIGLRTAAHHITSLCALPTPRPAKAAVPR